MRLRFTRHSLRGLDHVHRHISETDPSAANRVIARIREPIEGLRPFPFLGRSGRIVGTRELAVSGTRHVVPNGIIGESIVILAVMDGARP